MASSEKTNASSGKIDKADRLSAENYIPWSYRMEFLLSKLGLWEAVTENAPTATTGNQVEVESWKKKDRLALIEIGLACDDTNIVHVKQCSSAKQAWKRLKDHHQHMTLGARNRITNEMRTKKLEQGGSMRVHLDALFGFFNKLNELGAPVSDQEAVRIMLTSVGDEYDALVTGMETWDEEKVTVYAVKSKLMDEWEKKKLKSSTNSSRVKLSRKSYRSAIK